MGNRLKIKENIVTWSSYELDGKLPDVIDKLSNLMKCNQNHFEFNIEVESEGGYYGSCLSNIIIDAFRWETDEEKTAREKAAQNKKERDRVMAIRDAEIEAKRERSLYESLKRKFEKEINEGS